MSREQIARSFSPNQLIKDPLYHVNLVLWMLQPAAGAGVEPLLQKAGFSLFQIEPELTFPIDLTASLQKNGIAHSQPVNPDLLLCTDKGEYIPLECKSKMFGSQLQPGGGDSQVKQARSLLLLAPMILNSALAFQSGQVKSTHILYLSVHEPGIPQTNGLGEIANELKKHSYQTAPFGLLALGYTEKAIVLYGQSRPGKLPAVLARCMGETAVVVQPIIDDKTDPRPLYHLPWMPDNQSLDDVYSQQAFANRIFAATVADIGPCRTPCEIKLDIEKLLNMATNKFYRQWRDKIVRKQLQKRAKELLKNKLKEALPDLTMTSLPQPEIGWQFRLADEKSQRHIIEALRKGEQTAWNRPISQPSLFPEDDE